MTFSIAGIGCYISVELIASLIIDGGNKNILNKAIRIRLFINI